MLHGDRWAAVFVNSLGENAEAGLVCLKALVQPVKAVSSTLFGYSAARQLEKILRESVSGNTNVKNDISVSLASPVPVIEYAIRFIVLAVEKKQFGHIDLILQKIEEQIDAKKKILAVTVESAVPLDNIFEDKLRRNIIERAGATGIKMKTRLVPDLLGGYRLRIGGFYIDASLKRQIEKMETALAGGM